MTLSDSTCIILCFQECSYGSFIFCYKLSFFISNTFTSNTRLKLAKNQAKAKLKCVCFNNIIWFIVMKMVVKMKNTSHKYKINTTSPRHGYEYTKYIKCLTCNKQHLSDILSLLTNESETFPKISWMSFIIAFSNLLQVSICFLCKKKIPPFLFMTNYSSF